ncbi:Uma2 Endonuclease, Uma2 family (restriction endonuclease fold) [Spirosomataceae bacterium]|jgi:Uma2 family endonuclease
MGEPAPKHYYSIEEYIEIEKNSLEKYEYHDGEIFSMAGGTINHSLLANNMGGSLRDAIKAKGKNCRTFNSDAKIAITERKFVYADASVVCGKTETFQTMKEGIKNPILIVEVLSDSTALYDRELKFQAYQSMASFQEYILVSKDKIFIEVYYKDDGALFWQYRVYNHLSDNIVLKSIDVEIPLSEIYLDWDQTAIL